MEDNMKKLISLLLAVLMSLCLTACNPAANPSDNQSEAPSPTGTADTRGEARDLVEPADSGAAWVKAYLGVVEGLIAQYGEGAIEPSNYSYGDFMTGVGVIRLIDFDEDGTYELYCAYQNEDESYKQAIYGYDNGLVVLLEESKVSNPASDWCPSVTFLTKDGKVYLVDVYYGEDGEPTEGGSYDTLQDGKWVSVLNYQDDRYRENGEHLLNGETVTEGDLRSAIDEMEAGGTVEHISFVYDVDYDVLTKTQETIAEIHAQAG